MTELLTGWNELILAFALFFLSHIIPARPTIREWLICHIGKAIYLAVYSVVCIENLNADVMVMKSTE